MQAAMESCPAKTVIAGGMGFALGGAFGLFMSSVSMSLAMRFHAIRLTRTSIHADELRYTSYRARPATCRSTLERTTAERVQGYGIAVIQLREKLCACWCNILRDGVLYRRGMSYKGRTV